MGDGGGKVGVDGGSRSGLWACLDGGGLSAAAAAAIVGGASDLAGVDVGGVNPRNVGNMGASSGRVCFNLSMRDGEDGTLTLQPRPSPGGGRERCRGVWGADGCRPAWDMGL